MINFVVLGGLVRDEPEVRFSAQDEPICSFILSLMSFKMKVVCYGRTAVLAAKYVHQGMRVVVMGFIGFGPEESFDLTLIAYHLDLLLGPDLDFK